MGAFAAAHRWRGKFAAYIIGRIGSAFVDIDGGLFEAVAAFEGESKMLHRVGEKDGF